MSRRTIESAAAPRPVGPYSQAVVADGLVFCAGQIGLDPATGKLVTGGTVPELEQAVANLAAVLVGTGLTLDDVVKTTVFLVDLADGPAMNAAYGKLFAAPYPARSTVGVRALPAGARIEIEAIALRPSAAQSRWRRFFHATFIADSLPGHGPTLRWRRGRKGMLRTISALELRFCRALNAYVALPSVRRSFLVVSRLGDGFAWYALIFAMPLLTGSSTPTAAVQMAVTGLIASGLQMVLKTSLARERPFVASPAIACGIAPLDRYSFPSGHTLHAVCFTTMAVHHVPELAWILVPFTGLVMASRVILGLHYPSDVVAGAAVGLALAVASRGAFGA